MATKPHWPFPALLCVAAIFGGGISPTNLSVKQVRSIAASAALSAGYRPEQWVQQFVVSDRETKVWTVTYCNYPPHREVAGFSVTVHDDTRETAIVHRLGH